MALTAAQKKTFSKELYMNGYSQAQAAEILDISDALIIDYWVEWGLARIRQNGIVMGNNRGPVLAAEHAAGNGTGGGTVRSHRQLARYAVWAATVPGRLLTLYAHACACAAAITVFLCTGIQLA